ncbi:MAG: adenylate/guanylate cyclase domain-containing protein [Deltaproteobacteria bacterium]|nr:MAG: adenylate/guanylate cyclase domain-containing protein [Deltaproteobacteria bacterium]
MSRLAKGTVIGLATGILGLIVSFLSVGPGLVENLSLDLLFHLRGKRQAPGDVMIVALDDFSAKTLNLPSQPRKWPRSLHGRLTEYLASQGAQVIAFDINFSEPVLTETDQLFAQAIQKARNVVLCENLIKETLPLTDKKGAVTGSLDMEKRVPPIDLLARSSVALAPFPLPKVPIKVNQYWMFKTSAGDIPTLPVVVFQLFALVVYQEFIQTLSRVNPHHTIKLPLDKNEIIIEKKVKTLILGLRTLFHENPSLAGQMLAEIPCDESSSGITHKCQILKSLIKMYQGPDSRYLNFYGPPGTIPTISYCEVLDQLEQPANKQDRIDFSGKAVFIGYSERVLPNFKDGFYTAYSQPSGVDISGVEMTATAFANLLEDSPIKPLHLARHVAFIFFWGFFLGLVFYFFPTLFSLLGVMGIGLVYFGYARYQFLSNSNWYPLIVPLFLQPPGAFFGAILWQYTETKKDRENIRNAFGYYLPNNIIDQLVKNIARKKTSTQIVYGTCLCTDAGQYTRLSETMAPEELSLLMNSYYKTLFKPVKKNDGIVINIVGDSMLALWAKTDPDPALPNKACLAALEIAGAVTRFNAAIGNNPLPTRIGLHHGQVSLGNVGAMDHYEYRPTGDIVNTASRMEGLNKYLGTDILVTGEVMEQLNGFLARNLGKFLLSGKSMPVTVWELRCPLEESTDQQTSLCNTFSQALVAYREQSWEKAMNFFYQTIRINGQDGPSIFYLNWIEKFRKKPPGKTWEGIVRMDKK